MLWDALLRAKVVVDEASINNIQALTPRKSPGYVVPPSPPAQGKSIVEKAQDQVLAQTRKQFNQNFLGRRRQYPWRSGPQRATQSHPRRVEI